MLVLSEPRLYSQSSHIRRHTRHVTVWTRSKIKNFSRSKKSVTEKLVLSYNKYHRLSLFSYNSLFLFVFQSV